MTLGPWPVAALKAGALGLALATGIVGMALSLRWLVWVAAGLLAVAFVLRFVVTASKDRVIG